MSKNEIKIEEDEEMQITDTIKTGDKKNNSSQSQIPEEINVSNLKEIGLSNLLNNITKTNQVKREYAKIIVPLNRIKPVRDNWTTIVKVLVEHMKIQIRMNTKKMYIEITKLKIRK